MRSSSALLPLLASVTACAAPSGVSELVAPPASPRAVSAARPVQAESTGRTWRDRLVDPVSAPTTFESPIIETNVEPLFLAQSFPSDSAFDGGGFNVIAVQARYAVNERFAIIATKDGWIDLSPDAGDDESGLADIAAGVKYAWIDDPEQGLLVTPGITFELAIGDDDVFQDNGDGVFRPFVSAAKDMDPVDLIANVGYSLPLDGDEEVSSLDYHLHASTEVAEGFSPLVELNGITYTSDGETPFDFEGGDLINLGSEEASGNTLFTGALGFRWRATPHIMVGATFELPISSREDLLDDRFILDVLVH